MKRFTVLILAIAVVAMVAGNAFAAGATVVRGSYAATAKVTTTLATTAATSVLSSATIAVYYPQWYVNKTFVVHTSAGATSLESYTIWASPDNTNWESYDSTTLANLAADTTKHVTITGSVIPYWKVTGLMPSAGYIGTTEAWWFGSSN